MKVVKPVAIGDAQLVSSNAAETEYPAWAVGTTYSVVASGGTPGDRVIYQHKIYENIQAPNLGHAPDADPLYWTPIGPTNRWAMLDGEISTQTVLASPLTVVVKPGFVNSIGLFGLVGQTLTVTVRNGLAGPVVYTATRTLDGTIIADWYQYFFEPSVQLGAVVLTDLPPYTDAHITVSLSGTGNVACGVLTCGSAYDLGGTQFGATSSITDYSKKTTSATGSTSFSKGKFSKRISARTELDNGQLNKVQNILEDLRATPAIFLGTDVSGFELLTAFGFYKDFSIEIAYAITSYVSIEIEGLT